jgi:hypothetical protein
MFGPEITSKITVIPACGTPVPSVIVAVTVCESPTILTSVSGVRVIRNALLGVGIQLVKSDVCSVGSTPIPVFHAVETGLPPHFM